MKTMCINFTDKTQSMICETGAGIVQQYNELRTSYTWFYKLMSRANLETTISNVIYNMYPPIKSSSISEL